MISGITLRNTSVLAMLGLAPAISCAAPDVDALLARLARPAPATTPFVEVRYSKLLDQPLVVKGQLEYHEDGALVRAVSEPFRERTEIRGESVSVERVGRPVRRFSLERAPELRSMLGSFGAVLGGTRATLEQDFDLALSEEATRWQLTLTPKAGSVGKYVRNIVIQGHEGEPRCLVVTQPDAQSSIMVVGKAAESALPQPLTRDGLDRFCAAAGS